MIVEQGKKFESFTCPFYKQIVKKTNLILNISFLVYFHVVLPFSDNSFNDIDTTIIVICINDWKSEK